MIKIESVTKNFSEVKSLDTVTLNVPDGSIFGLIGSNGSGKSTLMRIMCGVFMPDDGYVLYDGMNIWENTAAKAEIVYLSDEQFFIPHATVADMRDMYRSLYSTFSEERYERMLTLFGLDPNRKINTFSKGMQKQTAILLALSVQPKYLFCDETFDGLDPVMRQMVKQVLAEDVAERKMTVIIASHNLRELEDICDRIALLHKGQLLFHRELDDMKLTLQKVQAVFENREDADVLSVLTPLSVEWRGSMATVIVRGTKEELDEEFRRMNTRFYEFIPLTLEEIFISEMGERGYDCSKVLG